VVLSIASSNCNGRASSINITHSSNLLLSSSLSRLYSSRTLLYPEVILHFLFVHEEVMHLYMKCLNCTRISIDLLKAFLDCVFDYSVVFLGGSNAVAVNLIAQHVYTQLELVSSLIFC